MTRGFIGEKGSMLLGEYPGVERRKGDAASRKTDDRVTLFKLDLKRSVEFPNRTGHNECFLT